MCVHTCLHSNQLGLVSISWSLAPNSVTPFSPSFFFLILSLPRFLWQFSTYLQISVYRFLAYYLLWPTRYLSPTRHPRPPSWIPTSRHENIKTILIALRGLCYSLHTLIKIKNHIYIEFKGAPKSPLSPTTIPYRQLQSVIVP